jgi:Fe-S-cluster containining protein
MHNRTRRSRTTALTTLSPLTKEVRKVSVEFLSHNPHSPFLIADLCVGLFESLDAFYDQNPPPCELACGPGCSFCCYNQVRATLPEIVTIVRYIQKTTSEFERQLLSQNIQRHNQRIRGISDLNIPRDLPCVFLKESKCSIYEVRPFACRAWHALNRSDCLRAFEEKNPLAPVEQYPARRQAALDFVCGLTQALDHVRLPSGDIILPLGIEAVLPFSLDHFEPGWLPLFQIHKPGNFPNTA